MQDRTEVARETTERWMRPAQCAEVIGVSVNLLCRWRLEGRGPRYSKLGDRVVVYSMEDVREWIEAKARRTARPTVAA